MMPITAINDCRRFGLIRTVNHRLCTTFNTTRKRANSRSVSLHDAADHDSEKAYSARRLFVSQLGFRGRCGAMRLKFFARGSKKSKGIVFWRRRQSADMYRNSTPEASEARIILYL